MLIYKNNQNTKSSSEIFGEMQDFLIETYKMWFYSEDQRKDSVANLKNSIFLPKNDFMSKLEELKTENENTDIKNKNKNKIGTIIQSEEPTPDTIEEIKNKIKIVDPIKETWYSNLVEKLGRDPYVDEVLTEISQQPEYKSKIFSDLKTYKILAQYVEQDIKNSDDLKNKLNVEERENWIYYLFPGTVFVGASGIWSVSNLSWKGDSFVRNGTGLNYSWDSNCHVVLLDEV